MGDHFWMWFIGIIASTNLGAIGLLITLLFSWRKELKEMHAAYCKDNEEDHTEIWNRVNHHRHDNDGSVVIVEKG